MLENKSNQAGPSETRGNSLRTNVRIATGFRPGVGIEVYGEYVVMPDDGNRLKTIKSDLEQIKLIEPRVGWKLQARGTDTDWHDFKS